MKQVAIFAFKGDPMCFIHVLLNALDMDQQKMEVKVIIEGEATGLIPQLHQKDHPLNTLWEKVKSRSLIAGVCKACAGKTGTLASAEAQGLALLADMNAHPSMAGYINAGYQVITL